MRKGTHHSEKTRRKLSKSHKGQRGYWKGKHLSKETKRKLSEANKGKTLSKETKKKISEALKGRTLSEEHKRKISEAVSGEKNPMYGKHPSEETRRKRSLAFSGENNPMYGKHHSKETRIKLSEVHKGLIPWNRGRKTGILSEKHRKKISENNACYWKDKNRSEATRRKISEGLRGYLPWNLGLTGETDSRILTGKNHPNWNNGSSFEPYGPEFNDDLKERVRERDNYQCQLCGVHQEELSRALDVHHIDYDKTNNHTKNLVALCHSCHSKTQVNREKWENYFRCTLSWREAPQAPLVEAPPLPQGTLEPA